MNAKIIFLATLIIGTHLPPPSADPMVNYLPPYYTLAPSTDTDKLLTHTVHLKLLGGNSDFGKLKTLIRLDEHTNTVNLEAAMVTEDRVLMLWMDVWTAKL